MNMYKSDRQRVEDAIIPYVLGSLMLAQVKEQPHYKAHFAHQLWMLKRGVAANANSEKVNKRLYRINRKIANHFHSNGYEIRKAYMIISYIAKSLMEQRAVVLSKGTKKVVRMMHKEIAKGCVDDDIKRQDISAAKQAPKVMQLILEEGYF